MAPYHIVEKSLNEVQSGEVLAESVGNPPYLPEGAVLVKENIRRLKELNVKTVKVRVSGRETAPAQDADDKKYDKAEHEKLIEENIEKSYYTRIMEREQGLELQEADYSQEEKKEAKRIIEHIQEAHEDITQIEQLEKKPVKRINDSINEKILLLSAKLQDMIRVKKNRLVDLEFIIHDLISDTGPKRHSAFLLLHVRRTGVNYVIRHSINVCLISLAIAMELTKMMTEKLKSPEVRGDFKKLNICDRKIFTKNELVKLGVSALVHDLNLLEVFPDLNENSKFSIKEKSKIELHSNNGYHTLTLLGADYIIRNTVLHHHERVDGSGYPDGLKGLLLSKYTLVLSFADRIEQLIIKSPFSIKLHPHKAIMYLLSEEKEKFDNDVTLSFCRAASLYPVGSWLLLSNNKVGIVYLSNKHSLRKPIVKCVYSSEMKELLKKEFIDLSKSDLKILELIDIEALKMFNVDIENFIFDEREFRRIPVNVAGRINLPDTDIFFNSQVHDVSLGGACIRMENRLKIGDEILLDFSLGDTSLENKGIVVWANEEKASAYSYGIRFLREDDNYKLILNTLI